jgi:O-antigen/teichoic acid export membrane protein
MQKKFLFSLFLMVLLNLLVKPLAIFGIDATVQNRVGAETYGLYFSLLNLSFLFNILLDLGINNFTTRNVAQHPHLASHYWGKLIGLRFLLFIVYALITIGIAVLVGYEGKELWMLAVLVFNQLLVTFIAFFRSHFGGLHLFKTDALISVLDRLLLILICGAVLFTNVSGGSFEIDWFIWIQTICYALTLIVAVFLLISRTGWPGLGFDTAFSWVILKKSLPYALLILLMMIYTRTDSVMLERLHPRGAFEAGIYAQGFRLLDALFMFGMIFANLLLPMFSRMLHEKAPEFKNLLHSSRDLLVGGALFVGFVCYSHAEAILSFIYDQYVAESVASFQLLMWVFTAMSLSLIYGTLLTAAGQLKVLNIISLIGVVLNILLNVYLIPEYGAEGAAFATLITQSLTAIVQAIVAHRIHHLELPIKTIFAFTGYVAAMLGLTYLTKEFDYFLLIQFFGGFFLLFVTGLIDLRKLLIVLQTKAEA